jgi:cell division protein FtsI/penicillin-binding protein 2
MINKDFFSKSSKILKMIFIFLFLLVFRIWHLCATQKDTKKIEAKQPQRKVIIEKAQRGTIRDRFDLPLAMNRIRFNAAIFYEQILQIPRVKWIKKNGKKIKIYPRKDYIEELVIFLSKELSLSTQDIEDQIYAKATLFPHMPYILKENISEKTYYRLKFIERKWPGLYAEISSIRYYPKNKVASTIIGTMGAIDEKKFISNAEEIKILEKYLESQFDLAYDMLPFGYQSNYEVLSRLKELKERSYSLNDLVGKYGIEKKFEDELRGTYGKTFFEVDVKGSFVKKLPLYTPPISGNNIKLTISAELQEFSEKLLATREKKENNPNFAPWIRGGAIIAINPNNGEILTLASSPNYNLNDFIPSSNKSEKKLKQERILQWLESTTYIGSIFDGLRQLTKEYYDKKTSTYKVFTKETSWNLFVKNLIPENSKIFQELKNISTLKNAISIQEDLETILYFTKIKNIELLFDVIFLNDIPAYPNSSLAEKEHLAEILKNNIENVKLPIEHLSEIFSKVKHNKDKLLIIDIFKVTVFNPSFSDELISRIGNLSLYDYFKYSRQILYFEKQIKEEAKKIFSKTSFQSWRENNLTSYLKVKRHEEKVRNTYARPYTYYLKKKKLELFENFWKKNKSLFLNLVILGINEVNNKYFNIFYEWHQRLSNNDFENIKLQKYFRSINPFLNQLNRTLVKDFLKTIRSFSELNRPLYGRYRKVNKISAKESDLASLIYPHEGFGYMRSFAYQNPLPFGSIFKIVTAYEALIQNSHASNLLKMIDKIDYDSNHRLIVGYNMNKKPYPRIYKNGRLPKSAKFNIGEIDFFSAMEQSSNPYFSILAVDYIKEPNDLKNCAQNFGFGTKTGIDLIGENSGNLPDDLEKNRSNLYSYAIGHHTLTVTPLQAATFLSAIANGGKLYKPKIVKQILGSHRDLNKNQTSSYQDYLQCLGIHSLILTNNYSDKFTMIHEIPSVINNKMAMPTNVKDAIFESMKRVVHGKNGTARVAIIKSLWKNPNLRADYIETSKKMIGKTSTAEITYSPYIIASEKAKLSKHGCFAAISFKDNVLENKLEKPDLVVIVYLPFESSGKEAAPIAAQIIKKWGEISSRAGRY